MHNEEEAAHVEQKAQVEVVTHVEQKDPEENDGEEDDGDKEGAGQGGG
jgi:hypothetical protein